MNLDRLNRITVEAGKCGGRPCIRGRPRRASGVVKFLVDNQLPTALAQYLRERGFDCQHVLEAGLGDALDSEICRHAEFEKRIINQQGRRLFLFRQTTRCENQSHLGSLGGIAELRHFWPHSSVPGQISNPA